MRDVLPRTEQYTHGGEIVLREPRDTLKASLAVDAMNLVSIGSKSRYLDEDCMIISKQGTDKWRPVAS
jgi:hypothetical protein